MFDFHLSLNDKATRWIAKSEKLLYPSLRPLVLFPQHLHRHFRFQVDLLRPLRREDSLDAFLFRSAPRRWEESGSIRAISKY